MRLDKFLSQQLGVSRASVMRGLRAKRVTVEGEIIKSGSLRLTPEQVVMFDGRPLYQQQGPRYFMLNKPQGCVCATVDPAHTTVFFS